LRERETEREHERGEGQRDREKRTPLLSWKPDVGLDPRTWDHDLSLTN